MFAPTEASRFLRFANDEYLRKIYLGNDFSPKVLTKVSNRLIQLDAFNHEPIVLEIDSNGGDFQSAHELAMLIQKLDAPVYGLVVGNCYSSAFHILQACHLRLALPMASLAFHNNFKIVVIKTTADMNLDVVMGMLQNEKQQRSESRMLVLRMMQERNPFYTEDELLQMMREERLLTAEGALGKGFIDEIVRY